MKIYFLTSLLIFGCASTMNIQVTYKPKKVFQFSEHTKINYEVFGKGKINLIFLHGFGASIRSWDDLIPLFSRDVYTIYLLDLKGHGFSSKPKDNNYTIDLQADIVNKFIENQQLKDVIIIGHSYGGGVALLAKIKSQEVCPITKLILIDCAAYNDDIPFFITYLRNPILSFISLNFTGPVFRAKYTLSRLFFDKTKVTEERIARYAYFFADPQIDYALTKSADQIIPTNYDSTVARYKNISVPVLVIWGRQDPIITLKIGNRLHSELGNSKLVIIDSCGHIPSEEKPLETYRAISSFLFGE